VEKKQLSKSPETSKPAVSPPPSVALTSAGVFDVAVHSAPPKGAADKKIHARRSLPATPEAAPRRKEDDEGAQ
jgi:hypothetical protein